MEHSLRPPKSHGNVGGPTVVLRQRAFRTRSATGCSPCKDARVKCQEGKPSCQRCIRLHIRCVYVVPKPRKKAAQTDARGTRTLLPAAPRPNRAVSPVDPCLSTLPRVAPERVLYYDFFRTRVVSQLCSQVPAGFWLRTVLRECTLDSGILDSAIGIGALAYVNYVRSNRQLPLLKRANQAGGGDDDIEHGRHYAVAVAHYTRALAKFRQKVSSAGATPPAARTILISSLLFLVFELLQGDVKAVDTLSASCFRVLKSDLLRRDSRYGPVIAANLDDEGVQDAEFLLVRLTVLHGLTSPLYPAAKETAQRFRLPLGFDLQIPSSSEPSIERFIIVWKHLWTLVSQWRLRLLESLPASASTLSTTIVSTEEKGEELQREKKHLLDLTEQCRRITQERMENETHPTGQRLLGYALALGKLHPIILSASANLLDDPWDRNLDVCLEIVNLGWQFINEAAATELSQSLIFDGPVPTLLQMVQGCRDRVFRDSATKLLARLVTPQSSWENKSLFLGSRGLMDLEELGRRPSGEIDLDVRYSWTYGEWSGDHELFHCTYTAILTGPGGCRREVRQSLRLEDYGLA